MYMLTMLISHTIADFIIQTDNVIKNKKENRLKGFGTHALGLIITSGLMLMFFNFNHFYALLLPTIIIILSHLIIDYIKDILQKGLDNINAPKRKLLVFVCDQFLHILIIIIASRFAIASFNKLFYFFADLFPFVSKIHYSSIKNLFMILYISISGAYFVPLVFDLIYSKVNKYNEILDTLLKEEIKEKNAHKFIDEVKTGKWIGIFERVVLVILLCINQFASIGFVIAAKSLARFKMMDNKIFSEYFLLGTLVSVIYSIVLFWCFNIIL